MKVEGKITDENGTASLRILRLQIYLSQKRVYSGRPAVDGSYFLYIREGSKYEMSIDPEQSKISYFAKQFDLTRRQNSATRENKCGIEATCPRR